MDDKFTQTVETLTGILIAGGPYAIVAVLVVLVLLTMQFAKTAETDADRKHFRQVHYVVLGMMFLSVVGVFLGAYFPPSGPVSGVVVGLQDQPAKPENPGDPPAVVQNVGPKVSGVAFYRRRAPNPHGGVDWHWIIRPETGARKIEMRLVHQYTVYRTGPAPMSLNGDRRQLEERRLRGDFVIDLNALNYHWPQDIQFEYRPDPDDSVRKLGQLVVRVEAGKWEPIEWLADAGTEAGGRDPAAGGLDRLAALGARVGDLLVSTLHAQAPRRLQRHQSARIRRDLASGDIVLELEARKALIGQGEAGYAFLFGLLDPESLRSLGDAERTNAVHAAWESLQAIEATGSAPPIPDSVLTRAAFALYWNGDYDASAEAFRRHRAPDALPDTAFFYQGQAYYFAERYGEAVLSYRRFLNTVREPWARSITRQNMGLAYYFGGDRDRAATEWRAALAEHADNADALNNLAWIYRRDRARLDEALNLVDRSLQLAPDVPAFLHTKGCVLLRLGQRAEALPFLEAAAAGAPSDEELKSDLKKARQGAGQESFC